MPKFSVLIPAKGRPIYTRDAVLSILRQDFGDFDVTLSNNGADPEVKAMTAEFMGDPRFHYIEQPNLLPMPMHWNVASRTVTGDYLLVLTNRSLLKQGALRKLAKLLTSGSGNVEIVTWGWDSYNNARAVLTPRPASTGAVCRLKTADELLKFARGTISMTHNIDTIPLAMNSCVARSFVEKIRAREGNAFQNIAPDYNFAFSALLNAAELVHLDEALFVSQGCEDSNGINATIGDVRPYVDSLGLAEPWEAAPIKAPLVYNVFAQDFLAALRRYGRSDIRAEWNKFKYYKDCLMEIRMKKNAGILTPAEIRELTVAVESALQNEDESLRASVAATRGLLNKIRSLATIVVGRAADFSKLRRLPSGGESTFQTALQAAGFVY
jgi:Glycosyl transferase family 2